MYKGSREAFSAALDELVYEEKKVVMVSADSKLAARAGLFANHHPENYVEVGIAEQCAVDVAAGLSISGSIPIVATYAGFITMRACEQVRTFVAYPNLNVKLVGFNAGLIGGEREGVTHQFYEDIGILRCIPNIKIICPSNDKDVFMATKNLAKIQGPVYLRLGSGREPVLDLSEFGNFEIGKARCLRNYGNDVVIFSHGFIMNEAIKAADYLHSSMGVESSVVEIHTIAPLDMESIIYYSSRASFVFTLEDHNINGGLGSAVAEVLAENKINVSFKRFGLRSFGASGTPCELLHAYGLDCQALVDYIKENLDYNA